MPSWMAFCEQAMASSWSWAMWAKWVSRVRVCSSTRGSDQLHSEAISTTFRAGEKGRLLARLTCHPRGPPPPKPTAEEAHGWLPRGMARAPCEGQVSAVVRTGSRDRAPSLPPQARPSDPGSESEQLTRTSGLRLGALGTGGAYLGQGGHGEVHEAQPVAGVHLQSNENSGHRVDVLVGTLGEGSVSARQPGGTGTLGPGALGHAGIAATARAIGVSVSLQGPFPGSDEAAGLVAGLAGGLGQGPPMTSEPTSVGALLSGSLLVPLQAGDQGRPQQEASALQAPAR